MKNLNNLRTLVLILAIGLFSCEEEPVTPPDPGPQESQARVLLSIDLDAQGIYPLHVVDDAETGTADIADAQEILKSDGVIMVETRDNFVYVNDFTGETFKKLEISEEGVLTEVGSVPNLGVNGNPLYTFLDDNRILLTSRQTAPADGVYSYQVINTSTMTEESSSTFTIPIQGDTAAGFSYMYATQYIYFEGNVYVPFVEAGLDDGALYDEATVAVFNATTLEFVKKITSDKTAALANGFNPSSAISESGGLYLSSSNTSLYAGNESVPSGIVRIKAGQTEFDSDYFLDVTAAT
ncbi:MAG: DUF4374 domain-containing protein, partial [Bacteroidota bacterium]